MLIVAASLGATTARAQEGPLGQFFRDLFGTGQQGPKKLDLIDRHAAAASRELSRGLEQSDSLIAGRQWEPAIKQLQYLVDLPEDALILKGSSWVSIKRAAEERLLKLPEEGLRAYLNQHAQAAADELARARETHDVIALCHVASRFRATPAGEAAADELASLLTDSGDLVAAAQWYSELERDGAAIANSPAWKSRAAAVWRALGHNEKSNTLDPAAAAESPSKPVARENAPRLSTAAWTEIYGGPGRWNSVHGDQPLLLEEWSSPASQRPALQEDLEQRQADLFAGSHRPIPVANVVAANGLMAVRSLGGLEVREVATGKLLWRARGRSTVESLLNRPAGDSSAAALSLGADDHHEAHPLSSFFYRDATIGQLSTDGRRLFAVSRKATLLSNAFDLYAVAGTTSREDHSFSAIVAIDFQTGQTLWTTGGSRGDAPFESPLAGVYFFGPPTVDGNELFVVGAAGADVNLYCLEASTGLPKWQQFIAQYDTTKIEDDFVRQMWSCTPAVTRGLVYCPTNAGWLVAVDRLRHRLAWATRYAAGDVSDRYQPQYSLSQVNERWAQTAPILTGGTLVFAPPELPDEPMQTEAQLFRVDAVTGKVIFKRGKAESIAVGGVYGDNVIVLGQLALEAWPPLQKWGARWSTPYPKGLTPCGLGVAVEGVYWLPFLEGAVVGFRLSDGGIEKVLENDALAGRLGNLIVHQDRVISSGPTGIVGLWQKKPFEDQLAERLTGNPRDLEARLQKARRLVSEQRFEEALQELDSADFPADVSADLLKPARDLQWQCLIQTWSQSSDGDEKRWKQLEALADSPERREVVTRMRIDRSIASNDWQAALDQCWAILDTPVGDVDDGSLHVQGDAWLAGRLLNVWSHSPLDLQEKLTQQISEKVVITRQKLSELGPRLEKIFSFHAEGRRLSLSLGLADAARSDLGLAESRLSSLTKAPENETAAAAATRLAELYAHRECTTDAARVAQLAAMRPPATPLPDGMSLESWLSAWNQKQSAPAVPLPTAGWNLSHGRVVRLGADPDFEIGRPVRVHGDAADWMADKRVEFASNWYGLALIDRATNRRDWTMPLASNGVVSEDWSPAATAQGSLLAVCSRGMIHVCSPRDRRVLWTWPLPARFSTASSYGWAEEQLSNQPTRTAAVAVSEFQANVGNLREGPLMAIAGQRLVLLGQHELVVFDIRTGEEQWRCGGLAPSAVLVADERTVCVSSTISGGPAAFRLLDGKPLESAAMQSVFARTFAVAGETVLTRQGLPALFSSGIRLVAEKPFSGETVWSHSMTAETLIQPLAGREWAGVESTGEVFVIDVDSGLRSTLGRLTPEQLAARRSVHVLADSQRVYVVIQRQESYEFSNVTIPNITLNGELVAFDRQQARMLWRERVRDTALLTASFADSPVIILAEHSVPERRRKALDVLHMPELRLVVLDKATGARVIEWSGATPHGSPAALLLDRTKQRIDIFLNHYNQNFNDRLRLQFGPSFPTTVP